LVPRLGGRVGETVHLEQHADQSELPGLGLSSLLVATFAFLFAPPVGALAFLSSLPLGALVVFLALPLVALCPLFFSLHAVLGV
jgi:hypothetical protein